MIIVFDNFEVDVPKRELRWHGQLVDIEHKVFELIALLIEHRERVVSKDELIERLWQGRFITDASLSTAVKSARRALGDSGQLQRFIKTIRGHGFRFVAELESTVGPTNAALARDAAETADASCELVHGAGRPSIAVLRFASLGPPSYSDTLAQGLPAELIAGLSRMRWLQVIARGSSFRFDPQSFDPLDVTAQLNVRYLVTGLIEFSGSHLDVTVEIQSANEGTLVWSDRFRFGISEVQVVRSQIVAAVISALEVTIPQFEAMRTRLLSEDQFDAWSHFHLGLTQAFRFNQKGRELATRHFQTALELDDEFARAHAGMSFVHWQNAFMRAETARRDDLVIAEAEARKALEINSNDPFANFCMGRALWLSRDSDASISWLNRGLVINPNYAHCHYTRGVILNIKGDYEAAHYATSQAMTLSPLDPLYYGMLANQTLSEIAQDNFEAAMVLAEKAVHSPGTYYYPVLWAAVAAELSGERKTMERWRNRALTEWPDASVDAMMQTFPLEDAELVRTVKGSLRRMGIP